ncbi:MAG TPA: dihydrolipoamide acetyltransferase family protein, partial [Bacillota bacterium]|nr:dihydrolipoamide acetyltransferase family protein [Bacillota bacterium]
PPPPPPTTAAAAPAAAAPVHAASAAAPAAARASEVGSRYSPAVRRLAAEHKIDLSQLTGSGAGGRVTREDVLAFVGSRSAAPAALVASPSAEEEEEPSGVLFSPTPLRSRTPAPAAPVLQAAPAAPPPTPAAAASAPAPAGTDAGGRPGWADEELLPLTAMRRTIAERMAQSKREIPHAWMMTEADVTGLDRLREHVRAEFQRREGFDLTYFPFFIKVAIAAIHEFPAVNGHWTDQGVMVRRRINVGMAVGLEDGLIVPVIRGADGLSIAGIARAARDLAMRAQAGKLQPDDVQGGTITLNNTGTFGSIASMPIIPPGQAGIVTMERVVRRPAVVGDGGIAVRSLVNICCSFDHRVLDGLQIGRFMKRVREGLEAYAPGDSVYSHGRPGDALGHRRGGGGLAAQARLAEGAPPRQRHLPRG